MHNNSQEIDDDLIPTQEQIDYHESILSIIDDDIAKVFRDFGYLKYSDPKRPLLAQIARSLKEIVELLRNSNIQITDSNQGHNNSGNN
ncbi:MAG: hypothetical protein PVG39_13665 [Desulfobacteraceae bacterium]